MKLNNAILIISLFFSSCRVVTIDTVDKEKFEKIIKEEKVIVVSCYKCGCVTDFLKENKFNDIKIYGDTTCLRKAEIENVNHLKQSSIDSLFLKNYNAVLFKKYEGKVFYKLLKTEDSHKFRKITTDFFKD